MSKRKYIYIHIFCVEKYFIVKCIMAGISNQNLLDFIEEKTNNNIKKKIVGVFPSNFITKFITFHRMMNEKITRYPFIIINTGRSNKKVHTVGVFLTFIQKNKYFYSTALGLMVLKNFYYKMIKKLLMRFSL